MKNGVPQVRMASPKASSMVTTPTICTKLTGPSVHLLKARRSVKKNTFSDLYRNYTKSTDWRGHQSLGLMTWGVMWLLKGTSVGGRNITVYNYGSAAFLIVQRNGTWRCYNAMTARGALPHSNLMKNDVFIRGILVTNEPLRNKPLDLARGVHGLVSSTSNTKDEPLQL